MGEAERSVRELLERYGRHGERPRVAAVGAIVDMFFADADYAELLEAAVRSEAGIAAEAGDAA